ncbi:hypothetical protein ACQCM2_004871, partial [Escherichia coli]
LHVAHGGRSLTDPENGFVKKVNMVIPDQSNQSNSLSVSTFGGSILVALNWCGYPQGTKVLNKRSNP